MDPRKQNHLILAIFGKTVRLRTNAKWTHLPTITEVDDDISLTGATQGIFEDLLDRQRKMKRMT